MKFLKMIKDKFLDYEARIDAVHPDKIADSLVEPAQPTPNGKPATQQLEETPGVA